MATFPSPVEGEVCRRPLRMLTASLIAQTKDQAYVVFLAHFLNSSEQRGARQAVQAQIRSDAAPFVMINDLF
jgi:hypothetical protein